MREIGHAVSDINEVTSNIASAVGQQDAATRDISSNAQSAAQGNETLVANIGSLSEAIGETNKAATSVLTASSDLTATAETLSREVDKSFRRLRVEPLEQKEGRGPLLRPAEAQTAGRHEAFKRHRRRPATGRADLTSGKFSARVELLPGDRIVVCRVASKRRPRKPKDAMHSLSWVAATIPISFLWNCPCPRAGSAGSHGRFHQPIHLKGHRL